MHAATRFRLPRGLRRRARLAHLDPGAGRMVALVAGLRCISGAPGLLTVYSTVFGRTKVERARGRGRGGPRRSRGGTRHARPSRRGSAPAPAPGGGAQRRPAHRGPFAHAFPFHIPRGPGSPGMPTCTWTATDGTRPPSESRRSNPDALHAPRDAPPYRRRWEPLRASYELEVKLKVPKLDPMCGCRCSAQVGARLVPKNR